MNKATKDDMRNLTAYECELINSFPALTAEELETVSDSFPHYVFIHNRGDGWEVSTSCCHVDKRYYAYLRQIETPEEYELLSSKHNEKGVCPYCGKPVTFKNTGKCGKFKSLRTTGCAALWKADSVGGKVFIQDYWIEKDYSPSCLTGKVGYVFDNAYVFMPGAAYQFFMYYGAYECRMEKFGIGKYISILEPFWHGWSTMSGRETDYLNVGKREAIENSFLRYSQLETYDRNNNNPMKYLTIYSLYPHAVEMLMKSGMERTVSEFVYFSKKNAASIKWDETDPVKAFGLTKPELREFMALPNRNIGYVECFKYCKKQGWKTSFEDISAVYAELRGSENPMKFYRYCKKYKLTPTHLYNYLNKLTGPRCYGGYFTFECAFQEWTDYLYASNEIGYDMKNPVVILPKHLDIAHNEATGEHRNRLEAIRKAEERDLKQKQAENDWNEWFGLRLHEAAYRKRNADELQKRERRYSYSDGLYLIRPAANSDEIIAEGKALEHCVGGYAQRHAEGKLTICFMRKVSEPEKPWITIELQAGRLEQIHGYKNERDGKQDPRKEYKAFIDPWLEWVSKGSPRDAEGKPVTEKKTRKKKESIAA